MIILIEFQCIKYKFAVNGAFVPEAFVPGGFVLGAFHTGYSSQGHSSLGAFVSRGIHPKGLSSLGGLILG